MCTRDMYFELLSTICYVHKHLNIHVHKQFMYTRPQIFLLLIKGKFVKKTCRSYKKVSQMWKVSFIVKERQKVS